MKRLSRSTFGMWVAIVTALAIGLGLSTARAADESKPADWSKVLPEAEFVKLVEESGKVLVDAAKSAANLNLKARAAENETYTLLIYAQGGMKNGDKRAAALAESAKALTEAIRSKNIDVAKKHAGDLAKFKSMSGGSGKAEDIDLAKAVPIKGLMEQVKLTNKTLTDYRRMPAATFNTKAATDVALTSTKMAVLTMAIEAHAKEGEAAKGQTRKAWVEATEAVRAATLDMAAAAKAKKQLDFKNALNKMDTACTKCHDVFRVEVN